MTRMVALFTLALATASPLWAQVVLSADFSDAETPPLLELIGDAKIADGVLHTVPEPGWRRSGVTTAAIPAPDATWVVEYDFRPVGFGAQDQSFVSQVPSTHWYMVYVAPGGSLRVHLRHENEWRQRASSPAIIKLDQWYHVTVTLTATSFRYQVRERAAEQDLWDSTALPMDDLGKVTAFALVDEAPEAVGGTQWDNLTIATDSPGVGEKLKEAAERLQARRRAREQQRLACEKLREQGIALIPVPQEIELRPEQKSCPLTDGMEVTGCDEATRGIVASVLKERLGIGTVSQQDGGGVHLQKVNPADEIAKHGPQAYELTVYDRGALLRAATSEGFFYAAQTLCQLADKQRVCPGVRISDWPAIPQRLVMIAVSQGAFQVIDVEYWKRIIRELAAVKINYIMPYFEGGTFYYEKYPFLGVKGRDGFTIEKGKLLSEYAAEHFVKIVPQQEALGHSGNILTHEELADIRESGGVFCSSKEKTFQFLGDLFDELTQAFPNAEYIHVGGDEFGHGFAQCPDCKARAEQIGKPGLYAEHMTRLDEMLKQRNRRMMIWWHEEGFTEQAADKLPKGLCVFDWHYGNQASYPTLGRLQELGFDVWATPAVTRYYDGSNDWENTFGNISGFLAEGAERQVSGECTCTWVHGIWGGRNLFELNMYGLLFSGNCAWNPMASDYADFRWRFGRHWFDADPAQAEEQVLKAVHMPYGPSTEQAFWRSNRAIEEMLAAPLYKTAEAIDADPKMAEQAKRLQALCKEADKILARWAKSAGRNRTSAEFFAHDVQIHATLANRVLAVAQLRQSFAEAKKLGFAELGDCLRPEADNLRKLVRDYERMEAMFDRSVLEAGGGKAAWGGWFPFVAKGGVMFRVGEGRNHVQAQIDRIGEIVNSGKLPEDVFVR